MADVSDPKIAEAYEDVRNDKTETNWLLVSYENDKSNKLELTATGSGGLAELKEKLDPAQAQYAYVRVTYANDKESQRVKFILLIWIGESTRIMRKAKISVHASDVKNVLRTFSVEWPANTLADVNEDAIVTRLRSVGGASYSFYANGK